MQQHDIGNAEQWYQHQQRFGRRFILTCFGRICWSQLDYEYLNNRLFKYNYWIALPEAEISPKKKRRKTVATFTHIIRTRKNTLTNIHAMAVPWNIQSTTDSSIHWHSCLTYLFFVRCLFIKHRCDINGFRANEKNVSLYFIFIWNGKSIFLVDLFTRMFVSDSPTTANDFAAVQTAVIMAGQPKR